MLLFSVAFAVSFPLYSQQVNISNATITEGSDIVEVPVLISFPDSTLGFQLSIVWNEDELTLDTIVFNQVLLNQRILADYSNPNEGELRVLVQPAPPHFDIINFEKDSVGFSIFFRVTEQFNGNTELNFNHPDFPTIFAVGIDPSIAVLATVSGGSVSTSDGTVSVKPVTADVPLKVYPNPVSKQFTLSGLPATATNPDFKVIDALGRIVLQGVLENTTLELPASIDSGAYWLSVTTDIGTYVEPFVVRR